MVVISALAVLRFEIDAADATIRTANDALWWAMTTVTTVGYGDAYPVTSEGRIVAVLLMTAGVGLFVALSGTLAGWLTRSPEKAALTHLDSKIDELQSAIGALTEKLDEAIHEDRRRARSLPSE